jgi:predicted porin
MRKTFKMTAIAAAVAAAGFAGSAQADVTVFGKAHLDLANLTNATAASGDGLYVASHASRVGVKASEDLGDGLTGIAHLEFEVDMGDGVKAGSSPFGARNNFAGLKGSFGTVLMGIHDMPYKMSISKSDPFGDTYADYNNVIAGDTRQKNVVMYMNKFGDFGVNLAYGPNADAAGNATSGASVDMKFGPVDAGLGYESKANGASTDSFSAIRVRYNFGAGDVSVVGASEASASNTYASANFKLSDAVKLSLAYGQRDGASDALTAVGISDKLGKKTKVYAYYASGDLVAKAPVTAGGSAISFGLVQSF